METDRHASDGDDRHGYSYGEDPLEAAGTGGPRAADSGAADVADPAGAAASADPADGADPSTGTHPATGPRDATAPRAVLRPIPEGFPTPPPRPARPNRRPAPPPEQPATSGRPRGLLIAGISLAAVLLLIVVVGGGVLAVRSFSSADPAPSAAEDPGSPSTAEQSGPGSTEIGEVVLTEVSTEVGVRSIGGSSSRMDPEGEFVIVTFEVENPSSTALRIGDNVSLETADGTFPADHDATLEHTAGSTAFGVIPPDGSQIFHAVFDVPIGAEPTGLHLDLADIGESGTLPLGG
ncbi:hypothetical protein CFK38_07970 [Brachybacterium vulturis]|uniref:DUF4352 domain-containing protein n=1 Tax=Brachybacterium vulturis TaxID=2017484 RepID=A0A291GLU1_9MICO|nr:hypothetical protein [Brachybacterium vulturis]ATG51473.1 hypothetical protein CFK38_07970 [Brachybacterium vulturis]